MMTLVEGFETFARVIEVVSLEENDRQQARTRWKTYTGDKTNCIRGA